MPELLAALPELLGAAVEANPLLAYGLVALVMLVENIFPPVPSELVMPLAGFYVQQGKLELVPVVAAGLLGTVLGAWFWYGVGRLIEEQRLERWLERHGRWLGLAPADLQRGRRWFQRHGAALVFWGRVVPGVRPFVSVPAGLERMLQLPFLAWTSAGSLVWVLLLTMLGQALGEGYAQVEQWLAALTEGMKVLALVAAAAGIGWWVRHARRERRRR